MSTVGRGGQILQVSEPCRTAMAATRAHCQWPTQKGACQHCAAEVTWTGTRPRKWCSESCRKAAYLTRAGDHVRAQRRASDERRRAPRRLCRTCSTPISGQGRRYCSDACTPRRTLRSHGRLPRVTRACRRCGTEYETPSPQVVYCPDHRGLETPWAERKHTPGNASKNHRRRAATRGAGAELIDVRAVYERDGWRCHLCRKAVDPQLAYPHTRSASIDHLVPLSRGGTHELANVALAHLDCNRRRGTRGAAQLRWTA